MITMSAEVNQMRTQEIITTRLATFRQAETGQPSLSQVGRLTTIHVGQQLPRQAPEHSSMVEMLIKFPSMRLHLTQGMKALGMRVPNPRETQQPAARRISGRL